MGLESLITDLMFLVDRVLAQEAATAVALPPAKKLPGAIVSKQPTRKQACFR
jgi:hypothetical protein